MSAKYIDYYQTLGVPRGATTEEIQRAYRKLAREYHPDVNKEPAAEKRFKEIGEAYEVLKDAEKRKLYDELGNNWKSGQEFRPPPGWRPRGAGPGRGASGGGFRTRGGAGGNEQTFDFSGFEGGGFSDFFESIFGGVRGGAGGGGGGGFDPEDFMSRAAGGTRPRSSRQNRARAGSDQEVTITIPLADAFHGATRKLTLTSTDPSSGEERTRTYDVKIPPGVTEGSVIRLAGQGEPGQAGGPAGDLLLRISLAPDARFRLEQPGEGEGSGHNLVTVVPIAPWEAALGGKVAVPTPNGEVLVTIPAGSQSGQKLRIRGKGLPRKHGHHGDLLAELKIVVPRALTPEERAAYEQLAAASKPPVQTPE